MDHPVFALEKINLPPFTYAMEAQKYEHRLPAARRYIRERGLNQHRQGAETAIGIVMQGGQYNTTLRALATLGAADPFGDTAVSLLVLNAIHPLVPEEILEFLENKRHVLVVEEGQPDLIEREVKALAHDARLAVEIHGKDLFGRYGEYVSQVVTTGLKEFLLLARPTAVSVTEVERRFGALNAHRADLRAALPRPITRRPPTFCTGCPERPVFSALKILRTRQPEVGDTHVSADIGCHSFGTQAPFNVGNTILGYGMGLASASAVAPLFAKRVVSVMGDGGFWHNGLTNGVANAVFNQQDSVLVILENFYTSATGQQHNPSTGKNARNEATPMTIPQALRGLGVRWIRTVNPYRIGELIGTLRRALTTRAPGLKVVIARAECQLERQRREGPLRHQRIQAGQRVSQPRFGVDPEVCTGDHSCMRFNGCPSLTLRDNPDPLRDDPIAHVDQSCVGCGVCGEVAHAAVLCPSFYEVRTVVNPAPWERLVQHLRRRVIGALASA
jgi:indolepyruvate ferredoxin oxidoreductase alpha subunit